MKTIKQIADELQVSKQAVRNEIAKQGLQTSLRKDGNQFVVDDGIEMLIKTAFLHRKGAKLMEPVAEKVTGNLSGELCAAQRKIFELELTLRMRDTSEKEKTEIYVQELKRLDDALKEKDEQINQLHKIIDQEQQLRMVMEQKLLLVEEKQVGEEPDQQDIKESFWKRVFNGECHKLI